MKPIFCIVGKSGSGKSTILDYLTDIDSNPRSADIKLKKLIYHTTREIREGEVDGVDYYFMPPYGSDEFKIIYNSQDIIEERIYQKFDEVASYYTTYSDIEDSDANILVCAASVDQAISYYEKLDNVYIICIDMEDTKTRIKRLIDRANTENEIMEVCRRTLYENDEFARLSYFGESNVLHIENCASGICKGSSLWYQYMDDLINEIYEFIDSKIDK